MTNKLNLKHLRSVFAWSIIVFFSASIAFIAFWWSKEKTNIPYIKFSETKILDASNYLSLIESISNKEIETINFDWVVDTLETHPYIEAVRVSIHYPSQIVIEIIEREPIAIVNKRPLVLLDRHGIVLPNEPDLTSYNLPFMSNFNSDSLLYPPGQKTLSSKLEECILIVHGLKNKYTNLYDNLSEFKITSDNEIELVLYDQSTQIFLGNNLIDRRLKILSEFEKELNPKKISEFSYLDMRYDNQVITKNRNS